MNLLHLQKSSFLKMKKKLINYYFQVLFHIQLMSMVWKKSQVRLLYAVIRRVLNTTNCTTQGGKNVCLHRKLSFLTGLEYSKICPLNLQLVCISEDPRRGKDFYRRHLPNKSHGLPWQNQPIHD